MDTTNTRLRDSRRKILCEDLEDILEALEAPEDFTEDPAAPVLVAIIIDLWAVCTADPRWACRPCRLWVAGCGTIARPVMGVVAVACSL